MKLTRSTGLSDLLPSEFYLSQNHPNPFSETTTIKLCVAYKTNVKLEVFNSEGMKVQMLIDEEKEAGTYEVEFSAKKLAARSARGISSIGGDTCNLSEGIYVYQLRAGDFSATKKMMLLKRG
jgi:hypothetical protein